MAGPKSKKITTKKSKESSTLLVFQDFKDAFATSFQSYNKQVEHNPKLKLIDVFCVFLVLVGVIQFLFALLVRDSFPFNAFLAGFIMCVGQFVLLVSLRLQILNTVEFPGISSNRSFAEFVLASLTLHFICLHFIN
ncbi:Dolichyl-diphosphooligosaccharide--protein glycosyltransferase subunit OST2 [Nakaseomyces bracarensis]|uniref:Dolichyl-diphosphooligosaccharide--protein glycosyltransferase subunit OST2 n=1 Tax=Nakaseomyces bracarensis TaxID=273131 RepID=A0ABR4NML2_9SACH